MYHYAYHLQFLLHLYTNRKKIKTLKSKKPLYREKKKTNAFLLSLLAFQIAKDHLPLKRLLPIQQNYWQILEKAKELIKEETTKVTQKK